MAGRNIETYDRHLSLQTMFKIVIKNSATSSLTYAEIHLCRILMFDSKSDILFLISRLRIIFFSNKIKKFISKITILVWILGFILLLCICK